MFLTLKEEKRWLNDKQEPPVVTYIKFNQSRQPTPKQINESIEILKIQSNRQSLAPSPQKQFSLLQVTEPELILANEEMKKEESEEGELFIDEEKVCQDSESEHVSVRDTLH